MSPIGLALGGQDDGTGRSGQRGVHKATVGEDEDSYGRGSECSTLVISGFGGQTISAAEDVAPGKSVRAIGDLSEFVRIRLEEFDFADGAGEVGGKGGGADEQICRAGETCAIGWRSDGGDRRAVAGGKGGGLQGDVSKAVIS